MAEVNRNPWPRCRPIPSEAMEVISDVLLASAGRDKDYPAYSEDQLCRKERRASKAEEHFEMLLQHCGDLGEKTAGAEHCDLPQDELTVWKLHCAGYKASEIARALGFSRPTAVRLIKSAARRLAARGSAYAGLEGMYSDEVHKRLYRRPMHCAEQPCRKLGYCRYALREWAKR